METDDIILQCNRGNQADSSSEISDTYITAVSTMSTATPFGSESINVEDVIRTALRAVQRDADIDLKDSLPLFDCLAAMTRKTPESIRNEVVKVLENHKKRFQIIVKMFETTAITNDEGTDEKELLRSESEAYEHLISQCNDQAKLDHEYLAVYIYASATSLNLPIYIFCETRFGFAWEFYPPLFEFEGQPVSDTSFYVTMYMSPAGSFCHVATETVPTVVGVVGSFSRWLEETAPDDIEVPRQLLNIPKEKKEEMIRQGNADTRRQACNDIRNKLESNEQDDMNVLLALGWAFEPYCKILIKNRDFRVLAIGMPDKDALVTESEYINRFMALCELDQAIVERNTEIGAFVAVCKDSGAELDRRRKNVTTAVIASSSVGIVSGGLAVVGLALAPFSFGASLGLTIAGGVIGAVCSLTSGGARTVEAVKQNTKVTDIKEELAKIEKNEMEVSEKLSLTQQLFENAMPTLHTVQIKGPGMSKRGILAVGSAARGLHSGVSIALSAVRLSATAATVSAAILGPLSVLFDIAFLAEAAHNKRKGDKTNAGQMLQDIAETIDVKNTIFNSMLRGNCPDLIRLVHIKNP